jgi:hypothetical protein
VPVRNTFWELRAAVRDAKGRLAYHVDEFYVSNEGAPPAAFGIPNDAGSPASEAARPKPVCPRSVKFQKSTIGTFRWREYRGQLLLCPNRTVGISIDYV